MPKKIGKLAKKYAKALLRSVEAEQGSAVSEPPTPAQLLAQELQAFARDFFLSKELGQSILSHMFPREQRLAALLGIAQSAGLADVTVRFLRIAFERDRLENLAEIAQAFAALADEAALTVPVAVTSASTIAPEEVLQLEKSLSRIIKGRPVFHYAVDPGLIGGMIVRYSGKVIDGSIAGRLEQVKRSLLAS